MWKSYASKMVFLFNLNLEIWNLEIWSWVGYACDTSSLVPIISTYICICIKSVFKMHLQLPSGD